MFRRSVFPLLLLAVGLLGAAPLRAEDGRPLAFGDPLPEITLSAPTDPESRSYLNLGDADTFRPGQLPGDLLLLEMLNVHCSHCQMQAPSYNELFNLIESHPETRGRIKMLGVAAGNTLQEVETFRERYGVKFPVVPDPSFRAWRAVGGEGTPFSLYVRLTSEGAPAIVAGTHLGLNTQYRKIYEELQQLAGEEPEALQRQGKKAEAVRRAIQQAFSGEELEYRVRKAFIGTGGRIVDFSAVELRSGRRVYTALMRRGEEVERLFAEAASRKSVCDICHDAHFIYVFDQAGRIVAFDPLQLTKYGNVDWDEKDLAHLRNRVVGRSLTAPRPFDPEVDAVTSATMTSALIFNALAEGEALLKALREKGLR